MFGIGMSEMILICALALIVVGPDKLPEMARSIAKTILELKKTATGLKENITAEITPALDTVKPELEEASKALKENLEQQNRFAQPTYNSDRPIENIGSEIATEEKEHALDDHHSTPDISTDEFITRAQQAKDNSIKEQDV